jgi:hypothetical protein
MMYLSIKRFSTKIFRRLNSSKANTTTDSNLELNLIFNIKIDTLENDIVDVVTCPVNSQPKLSVYDE